PYDIVINKIAANVSVTRSVNAHDITMIGQFLVDEDVRAINWEIGFDLFPLPYDVILGQRPE
ncbi:MAG: hypothetical protein FWG38_04805, partial [Defluviitaleaceae bacterium]|nr:hypothetical protein [Defluviitaleaceae bacterium]